MIDRVTEFCSPPLDLGLLRGDCKAPLCSSGAAADCEAPLCSSAADDFDARHASIEARLDLAEAQFRAGLAARVPPPLDLGLQSSALRGDCKAPPPRAPGATLPAKYMRALHAAGKRRGLTHEDLRAVVGVTSLRAATVAQALAALRRLSDDRPVRGRRDSNANRVPRGAIRNATPVQRAHLRQLFRDLGWPESEWTGWLLKRHQIADLDGGVYSTKTASAAISAARAALQRALGER